MLLSIQMSLWHRRWRLCVFIQLIFNMNLFAFMVENDLCFAGSVIRLSQKQFCRKNSFCGETIDFLQLKMCSRLKPTCRIFFL